MYIIRFFKAYNLFRFLYLYVRPKCHLLSGHRATCSRAHRQRKDRENEDNILFSPPYLHFPHQHHHHCHHHLLLLLHHLLIRGDVRESGSFGWCESQMGGGARAGPQLLVKKLSHLCSIRSRSLQNV